LSRRASIDSDATVQRVAGRLQITARDNLPQRIVDCVERRLAATLHELGASDPGLDDLRAVVQDQTKMKVVRIESDEALAQVAASHAGQFRALDKQLSLEFEKDTEALVLRTDKSTNANRGGARYTAFVDARGDKSRRAWFSEWHESSHLMIPDDSDKEVYRRTRVRRPEPIEQVVDAVASRIAFWQPSVEPIVRLALSQHTHVLEAFEAARLLWAPEASQESAYIAFSNLIGRPLVLIRAQVAGRRADAKARSFDPESYALRAVRCIHSPEARGAGLYIPANYRIPPSSSIAAQSSGMSLLRAQTSAERLGAWTSSDGRRLKDIRVLVTVFGSWASVELA
jgi:hypothetical protein